MTSVGELTNLLSLHCIAQGYY